MFISSNHIVLEVTYDLKDIIECSLLIHTMSQ